MLSENVRQMLEIDSAAVPALYRCYDRGSGEVWETYSKQMRDEYLQCKGEGLDIEPLKEAFEAIHALEDSAEKALAADRLFEIISGLKQHPDFPYQEPNSLEEIKTLRPEHRKESRMPESNSLKEKLAGAWYGRIAGCLLGKTIEGIRTEELIPFLKESGNFPMHRYIETSDLKPGYETRYKYRFKNRCYADQIECAPVDDDTNYTCLYQQLINKYGRSFTSEDVCVFWQSRQPKTAYCTAERVAFCNMVKGLKPPYTATFENPYREWIGAQIRADYFGYINPGDPESAAEMAWRDACISHTKNGIYGEMMIAAMIAEAAVEEDLVAIIQAGLNEIPKNCRLQNQVRDLLKDFADGMPEEKAFAKIYSLYDEHTGYGWCHTISNALIVCASMLYTGGIYGKAVCRAVQSGFDTDCNAATVGSILGMRSGIDCIDEYWLKPLNGVLDTTIIGVGKVGIDSLIECTLDHISNRLSTDLFWTWLAELSRLQGKQAFFPGERLLRSNRYCREEHFCCCRGSHYPR